MITTELLTALMSPEECRRREAEAYLQQMTVQDRASQLLQWLINQRQEQPHYQKLVAVLLRRDILKVTDSSALRTMVEPLLQIFLSAAPHNNNINSADHRHVRLLTADCLAEVCAMLETVAPPAESQAALQQLLPTIATPASQGDTVYLGLLTRLADRAPRTFCGAGAGAVLSSLPQLIQSALAASSSSAAALCTVLNSLTDLIVTVAVAVSKETKDDATVAVAQLGASCWLPLVAPLQQLLTTVTASGSEEQVLPIFEHWVRAAEQAPALLAADPNVLEATVQACLGTIAAAGTNSDGNDGRLAAALRALQVLAMMSADTDVRHGASMACPRGANVRTALLQESIPFLIGIMTTAVDGDLESVEDWARDPATLEDLGCISSWDEDATAVEAEELLQSLIHSFSDHALVFLLPAAEQRLSTPASDTVHWREHRAALSALQCSAEAAPVSFARHIPIALEAALAYAKSANPRVQFQSVQLLGLLCESHTQTTTVEAVRERYGPAILMALASSSSSPSCTKVAAMACSALVSYCRPGHPQTEDEELEFGQRFVVPYLADVMAALLNGPLAQQQTLSAAGVAVVQIRAIGAIACLAKSSGAAFVPFYPQVMPGLLALFCGNGGALAGCSAHEQSQLRGSALEVASIVGQAVGDEHANVFVSDANQMMEWAVNLLNRSDAAAAASGNDNCDDLVEGVPLEQLLSACARIASVLRSDYAPYVQAVLPHLLKRATDRTDVELTEGNEAGLEATRRGPAESEDGAQTSVTVAVPGRGLTKITIHTNKIQAKAQAMLAVYEHAAALGANFGPYAQTCLDTFIPMLAFQYSHIIRGAAAQTVAAVFDSACSYCRENPSVGNNSGVPTTYLPLLARAIAQQLGREDTSEMDILYDLANSLSDIYYSVYQQVTETNTYGPTGLLNNFPVGDAGVVVEQCMKTLVGCLERRKDITRILAIENSTLSGDEREQYEATLESEGSLLTPLVDSVGYTLKFFREQFVPTFEAHVVPVLGPFLTQGDDIRARLSAVCLFDDCIEYCGAAAATKFGPQLAAAIPVGLDQSKNRHDEELVRACIYGVAQLARYSPSTVLAPYVQGILSLLLSITKGPKDQAENIFIYENAVSALASLFLIGSAPFQSAGLVKRDIVLKVFLDALPLREDEDEAKICHAGLSDLVEQNLFDIGPLRTQLLQIIGDTFAYQDDGEDLLSPETAARFGGILVRLQDGAQPEVIKESFSALSPQAKNAINCAMNRNPSHQSRLVTP